METTHCYFFRWIDGKTGMRQISEQMGERLQQLWLSTWMLRSHSGGGGFGSKVSGKVEV